MGWNLESVIPPILDYLRWFLGHDRTPESYPARFIMRIDLDDEIRKHGGGGIVEAVRALLYDRGYILEPAGTYETIERGITFIRDADRLFGCVEIMGKVIQPPPFKIRGTVHEFKEHFGLSGRNSPGKRLRELEEVGLATKINRECWEVSSDALDEEVKAKLAPNSH